MVDESNQAQKICSFCGRSTWIPKTSRCAKCKSEYTDRDYKELETFHGSNFSQNYLKASYKNWIERVEIYLPILSELMEKYQPKSAVDIGCGPNKLLRSLANKYPNLSVQGFDLYMRDEDVAKVDFDNEPIPYNDFPAELSVCSHVLEHVNELHSILDQILENSQLGFIAVPNPMHFKTLVKVGLGRELSGLEGLPLVKPMDRHRWMYTVKEADRFMRHFAWKHEKNLEVYYLTVPKYSLAAKLNKNLFVDELLYVFTPSTS